MDSRSILLSLLPVGLTLVNYAILRDLIWGIFLGSKSKKTANRIKGEQKGMQRFTQSYIGPLLTKYQSDYKGWTAVKRITFISVFVQIVAFVLLIAVFKVKFWIVAVICGVITLANIVLFSIMMNKTTVSDNKHDRKGSPWKFEQ